MPDRSASRTARERSVSAAWLGAHHRVLGIGPREDQRGIVGLAAQRVVAGTERAADYDREFRHNRIAHHIHKLRPGTNNAGLLGLFADHEALHVLEEYERNACLIAVHHEAGRFVGGVGIDDAADLQFAGGGSTAVFLVGDDADRVAADFRERRHERLTELGFVFLQRINIDDAFQHVADIVFGAAIGGEYVIYVFGIGCRMSGVRCQISDT